MVWRDAPGDGRFDVFRIDGDDVIKDGVGIRGEGFPACDGFIPIRFGRGVRATFEEVEGGLVWVDVTAACAALDRHVADRHALFHGEVIEGVTCIFVGVTDAAFCAEHADDVEGEVLGVDAGTKFSVHLDLANLERFHGHGLGGENVAHLSGADAEGDRAEGSVSRGVRVTTSDGGTRLGDALLGSDNVDDALFARLEVEISDAEVIAVRADGIDHLSRKRVGWLVLIFRRNDVVDGREGALRILHLEIELTEHAEGLRACHLVNEVRADEKLGATVAEGAHGVCVPDLLIECFSHGIVPLVEAGRGF